MNREDIEKVAYKFAHEAYMLGYADYDDIDSLNRGFFNGAEWRINSVWHKPDEQPQDDEMEIVILTKGRNAHIPYRPILDGWEKVVRLYDMEAWAYVSDLLPERKEETK